MLTQLDRRILVTAGSLALLFWLNIGLGILKPATGSFVLKWIPGALLAFLIFRHQTSRQSFLLFCAILVQSMGAVVLDFDRTGYVLYSMAFTAGAHLLFAAAFFPGLPALRASGIRFVFVGAFLLYAVLFGGFIASYVPSRMFTPVVFYMIALSLSAGMAVLSRYPLMLVAGVFCFVLDDSIFSWHLFVSSIPANHFLTWPSYIAGQTLVTLGFLKGRED